MHNVISRSCGELKTQGMSLKIAQYTKVQVEDQARDS